VRPRGLLRRLQEQARHQAFPPPKHPIIRSIEPGEEWGWCYVDNLMLDFSDPQHPSVADE
jgi:hypothetical protein